MVIGKKVNPQSHQFQIYITLLASWLPSKKAAGQAFELR
jgi:hypothetical protein